jgi:hypothetical protein
MHLQQHLGFRICDWRSLDLQTVLNTAFECAAYDLGIDSRQSPTPSLPAEYTEWGHQLLKDQGLR